LLLEAGAARQYVTMDVWESHEAYEAFRETFAAKYAELDEKCVVLMESERHLGEYEK
jgi:hypothetical protein